MLLGIWVPRARGAGPRFPGPVRGLGSPRGVRCWSAHLCMHAHIQITIYSCAHISMHTCLQRLVFAFMCACKCVCPRAYLCVRVCVCVCACASGFVHARVNAHAGMHTHARMHAACGRAYTTANAIKLYQHSSAAEPAEATPCKRGFAVQMHSEPGSRRKRPHCSR